MTPSPAMFRLTDVCIAVQAPHPIRRYLRRFYDSAPHTHNANHVIEVTTTTSGDSPTASRMNAHGVGIGNDGVNVWVSGGRQNDQAITTRQLLRALWLRRRLERGAVVVHASGFYTTTSVVLVLGESYSGKSTLMLDAVLRHGWRFLADDRLVLWRCPQGRLVACPLPSVVRVRRATERRLRSWLPARKRRRLPSSATTSEVAYWSPAALSSQRLPVVDMTTHDVTVLQAHFTPSTDHDEPGGIPPAHIHELDHDTGHHLLQSRSRLDQYAALTAEELLGPASFGAGRMATIADGLATHLSDLAVCGDYEHAGAFDPAVIDTLRVTRTRPRNERTS